MGVQKHYKKRLQKNRVEKFFKKIQNRLFLDLFLSRFWAFLGEGSSKTRQKNLENKPDQPWYFFGPRGTNQPRQGPSLFFLVPLGLRLRPGGGDIIGSIDSQ
jgi:hypothetical protein